MVSTRRHRPRVTHLPLEIGSFLFLLAAIGLNVFGVRQATQTDVLAYATNTTISGLLSATNAERTSRGLNALTLTTQLASSSQAKSNDMVSTDYWAHNRPDGTPPWAFFTAAGYQGLKEGENLAYGQLTSQQAVNEWMASPSHRDNILDTSYCEVGFGISNSANFVSTGPQTVVAAHYGQPVSGCPSTTPVAAPQPSVQATTKTTTPTKTVAVAAPSPTPTTATPPPPTEQPKVAEVANPKNDTTVAYTNLSPQTEPEETRLTRVQLFTRGKAPWATYVMTIILFGAIGAYVLKHAIGFKKTVLRGEKWVLHHPALDMLILGIIAISFYLTRSIGGVIK